MNSVGEKHLNLRFQILFQFIHKMILIQNKKSIKLMCYWSLPAEYHKISFFYISILATFFSIKNKILDAYWVGQDRVKYNEAKYYLNNEIDRNNHFYKLRKLWIIQLVSMESYEKA